MKKGNREFNKGKAVIVLILVLLVLVFVVLPLGLQLFGNYQPGNVALIPIEGLITTDGSAPYPGVAALAVSSSTIVNFIEQADANPEVQVILLEINSPGGSAVASDEIASAIKKVDKPVIALIREVGASGGYWIASAADYIIANKMSITGSIGVISSYLEFSGLMEKYGVDYERMVAGEYKDIGTPLKELDEEERKLLQRRLNKVHQYFIQEIVENRQLPEEKVREAATGEFFLGVEALDLGLVDQLGDKYVAEAYIQETYELEQVQYVIYQEEVSFFDLLSGVLSDGFFKMGQGMGSLLVQRETRLLLT